MARAYHPDDWRARLPALAFGEGLSLKAMACLLIVFWAALSVYRQSPPAVVPASAPPGEFSAERAMKHVAAIAGQPHPMGSPAHAEVRDYILGELAAAGLSPQVQQTLGVNREWEESIRVGAVQNLWARVEGTERRGKPLLLTAHYDSRPNSFGAGDDGAGVAALLEALRALKAGPPPKNDVIFLFTDGEEDGLLGARAFVDECPLAKEVGLVLNFEARGNGGPSIMFETSEGNGWLVEEFARSAPSPISHSLAYEIYRLLPNDTDLTVFKKAGLPGLNFAFISGLPYYHTSLDRIENLDGRSLQHHGSYALALARRFGNESLGDRRQANAVYFDILGYAFIHYPGGWVIPFTAGLTLLLGGLFVVGWRRGRLSLGGLAYGALAFLASFILSPLVVSLVWSGLLRFEEGLSATSGGPYEAGLYMLGLVALTVALTSAVYALFVKRVGVENLAAGALLCWLILLWLASLYLPGASYLLSWPLLFSLFGLGGRVASGRRAPGSGKLMLLTAACAVPGLILLTPAIYQSFIALTLNWGAALMAMVVLLLGLLVPQLCLLVASRRWLLPAGAAFLGAGLVAAGGFGLGADRRHPKQDSLLYGLNANTRTALWASNEATRDEWTSQFLAPEAKDAALPELFNSTTTRAFLKSAAPAVELQAPEVALLEDRASGEGVRTLRLRVSSPRRANIVSIYVDSKTEVLNARLDGKSLGGTDSSAPAKGARPSQWSVRYFAFPLGGVELTLETKSTQPVEVRAVDQSYGLPALTDQPLKPRPAHIIPSASPLTDATFVSKSFVF